MGVQYQFAKRYQNFFGYDLRSNDLEFPEQRATDVENIQYTATGTIEKRVGYQVHAETGAKYGLFAYNRVDSNGVEQQEVLGISSTLIKFTEVSLTVTYSGLNPVAQIAIFYDTITAQYRCQIQVGTSSLLDYALGLGRDEVSPVTVTQLATQINALTSFTATVTGTGATPAAFLKTIPNVSLINAPMTTNAGYWATLNVSPITGKAGPFIGSQTNKDSINFENVTAVQLQNCMYFANGYDFIMKYDGQNVYRAGLPPASDGSSGTYTVSISGGTAGTTEKYVWRQQFIQVDNAGNRIEGNTVFSSEQVKVDPGTSAVTVGLSNIQAGTGFNTNCAIVAGAQTTVTTINVDNGSGGPHTLKVGDTAYFYDAVSAGYVERRVTNVAANTITISGAAVTVVDNAVISNNLRIRVLRNKNTTVSPTLWFELVEIPNNSFAATQSYTDSIADSALFLQFLEPATDRSPPVAGKYISAYQNLMVTAGNLENSNEVSFSDLENPEYFPLVRNQFRVTNLAGDLITALHPSNDSFLIFQSRAIHSVTGDVPNQTFRVDVITQDIGCAAHASIQDVRGTICFLSLNGPRVMTGANIPRGLGEAKDNQLNSRIDPLFNIYGQTDQEVLRVKRAIAINDRRREKYICFVPAETVITGMRFANANSVTIVYDYTRDAWVKWSNLNCSGGLITAEDDKEILFVERRDSDNNDFTATITHYLYRFHNSGTFLDYQDHNQAIECFHKSPWEFMGEAGVLKTFTRIKVYSTELLDAPFTLDIQTEKDFVPDAPICECSIDFGSDGYGVSPWESAWGDPSNPGMKHKLSNGRCVSLRVILSNNQEQTNIAVTGYELEMALPYKPGFKS